MITISVTVNTNDCKQLRIPFGKSLMNFKDEKERRKHYRLSGKYHNNKKVK